MPLGNAVCGRKSHGDSAAQHSGWRIALAGVGRKLNRSRACGADDGAANRTPSAWMISAIIFLAKRQILFFVWVTFGERKWSILAERRGERARDTDIDRYAKAELFDGLWHREPDPPSVVPLIAKPLPSFPYTLSALRHTAPLRFPRATGAPEPYLPSPCGSMPNLGSCCVGCRTCTNSRD